MDDLFLKIISGEIPSTKVYEDEETIAILDISPHNHGHTLVIPKKQYKNIFDISEETLCAMMKTVRKLAPAVIKAVGAQGVNIGMNNETAAGQEVMHAHIHIVPRFDGDGVYKSPRHLSYAPGEEEEIAQKIRENI